MSKQIIEDYTGNSAANSKKEEKKTNAITIRKNSKVQEALDNAPKSQSEFATYMANAQGKTTEEYLKGTTKEAVLSTLAKETGLDKVNNFVTNAVNKFENSDFGQTILGSYNQKAKNDIELYNAASKAYDTNNERKKDKRLKDNNNAISNAAEDDIKYYQTVADNNGNIDNGIADLEAQIKANNALITNYKYNNSDIINPAQNGNYNAVISELETTNKALEKRIRLGKAITENSYYSYLEENGSDEEKKEYGNILASADDNLLTRLGKGLEQNVAKVIGLPITTVETFNDASTRMQVENELEATQQLYDEGKINDEQYSTLNEYWNNKLEEASIQSDNSFTKKMNDYVTKSNTKIFYNTNDMQQFALQAGMSTEQFVTHFLVFGPYATATMGLVSFSDQYNTLLNETNENGTPKYDAETMFKSSMVHGLVSYMTEKIGMDNFVNTVLSYGGTDVLGHIVNSVITQGLSEGGEEIIEGIVDPVIDSMLTGEEVEIDGNELLMSFLLGATSGAAMAVGGSAYSVVNVKVQTKAEYNKVMAEVNYLKNIRPKLTADLQALADRVIEKGTTACNLYKSNSITADSIVMTNEMTKQTSVAQDSETMMKAVQPDFNTEAEVEQRINKSEAEIYKTTKNMVNRLGVDMPASMWLDLTNEKREEAVKINDWANKLGVNLKYGYLIYDGEMKDGQYGATTDEIIINPYSDMRSYYVDENGNAVLDENGNKVFAGRTMTSTFVHEFVHSLEGTKEYNNLANLVKDENYDRDMKKLRDVYHISENVINQEYTAIRLQQMLEDGKFIDELANNNISLFNKLYKRLDSLFATTNDNRLEKIKRSMEEAYQQRRTGANTGLTEKSSGISLVDSKNDALTKDQVEYFKDSKITDKNGNLKVMYHATGAEFDAFDITKAKNGRNGRGFYFSNFPRDGYGKVGAYYLNITNPVSYQNKSITKEQFYNFLVAVNNNEDMDLFNWGKDATPESVLEKVWSEKKDDYSLIGQINITCIGDMVKAVKLFNEVNGTDFDGIEEITETVAFYPEQIKSIDNKTPTKDARYMHSSGISLEENEEYLKAVDTKDMAKAQELVDRAANNLLKQSKVRDEDGNLILVYHASPSAQFYKFDKTKASPEGNLGAGFYFTSDKYDANNNYHDGGADIEARIERLADMYESEDLSRDEAYEKARKEIIQGEGTDFEVYLDIKNPVYIGENETSILSYDDASEYAEGRFDREDYEEDYEYEDAIADSYIEDLTDNIYDLLSYDDVREVKNILYDAYINGGVTFEELRNKLAGLYLTDDEGNYVNSEVCRRIFENAGYDGIIDSTVSEKFNMGLGSDTTHYVVFNPNQIKSADTVTYDDNGNVIPLNERFNTTKDDIRWSSGISLKQDEDYMTAVESNDDAKAKELVEVAANESMPNSVVRDENGKLKLMYHGTGDYGFTVFDIYMTRFGLYGNGFYFTDDKNIAEDYENKNRGGEKGVYTSYLNITNPIDMDAEANESEWIKTIKKFNFDIDLYEDIVSKKMSYENLAKPTNDLMFSALLEVLEEEDMYDYDASEIVMDMFKSMGYDGITHIGGGRVNTNGVRHRVYVAFEPNQIKSADTVTYDDSGNVIPLSERFNSNNDDIRWSSGISLKQDEEYMAAAESNDIEKAKAMVDEAADKAGYTKVYHGTDRAGFTIFEPGYSGGIYTATNRELAEAFSISYKNKSSKTYDLYVRFDNPLMIDATEQVDNGNLGFSFKAPMYYEILIPDEMVGYQTPFGGFYEPNSRVATEEISLWAKSHGYDGVIIENVKELDGQLTDDYIAFKPNQLKSADPITYDDNGNIIPLSERFNENNDDIRWSSGIELEDDSAYDKLNKELEENIDWDLDEISSDIMKEVEASRKERRKTFLDSLTTFTETEKDEVNTLLDYIYNYDKNGIRDEERDSFNEQPVPRDLVREQLSLWENNNRERLDDILAKMDLESIICDYASKELVDYRKELRAEEKRLIETIDNSEYDAYDEQATNIDNRVGQEIIDYLRTTFTSLGMRDEFERLYDDETRTTKYKYDVAERLLFELSDKDSIYYVEKLLKKNNELNEHRLKIAGLPVTDYSVKDGNKVVWTNERVDKNIKDYNHYGNAYVCLMTPDEYHDLSWTFAPAEKNRIESETKEKYSNNFDASKLTGYNDQQYMYFDIHGITAKNGQEYFKIDGQEGNHRSVKIRDAGFVSMPVVIFNDGFNQIGNDQVVTLVGHNGDVGGENTNKANVRLIRLCNENRELLYNTIGEGSMKEGDVSYSSGIDFGDDYSEKDKAAFEGLVNKFVKSLDDIANDTKFEPYAVQFMKEWFEKGKVSDGTYEALKNAFYNSTFEDSAPNFTKEEISKVRKYVKKTKIDMSNFMLGKKGDYGDFSDGLSFRKFARDNFGTFTFVRRGGVGMDVFYNEFNNMFPGLVDPSETDMYTQLMNIKNAIADMGKTERIGTISRKDSDFAIDSIIDQALEEYYKIKDNAHKLVPYIQGDLDLTDEEFNNILVGKKSSPMPLIREINTPKKYQRAHPEVDRYGVLNYKKLFKGETWFESTTGENEYNVASDYVSSIIKQVDEGADINNIVTQYVQGTEADGNTIPKGALLAQYLYDTDEMDLFYDVVKKLNTYRSISGQMLESNKRLYEMNSPVSKALFLDAVQNNMQAEVDAKYGKGKYNVDVLQFADEILKEDSKLGFREACISAIQKAFQQANLPNTWADKIFGFRYLAMLSRPATWVRNATSNFVTRQLYKANNFVKAGIESAMNIEQSNRTATVKIDTKKSAQNKAIAEQIYNNLTVNQRSKYESKTFKNGLFGKWSSFEQARLSDEGAKKKYFIYQMDNTAQARGIDLTKENMNSSKVQDIAMYADKMATEAVSHNKTELSTTLANIQKYSSQGMQKADTTIGKAINDVIASVKDSANKGNKLSKVIDVSARNLTKALVPFTTTNASILKKKIELSPVVNLPGLFNSYEEVRAGKAEPDVFIDKLSKAFTGTALYMAAAALTCCGMLRWERKEDDKDYNGQTTLFVGDKGMNIDGFDPWATIVAKSAALTQELMSQGMSIETIESYMRDIKDILINDEMETFSSVLQVMENFGSVMEGENKYGEYGLKDFAADTAYNFVSSFIPGVARDIARIMNNEKKSTYSEDDLEYFGNRLANNIPYLRDNLPTKTDAFGNAQTYAEKMTGIEPLDRVITQVNPYRIVDKTGVNNTYTKDTGVSNMSESNQTYYNQLAEKYQFKDENGDGYNDSESWLRTSAPSTIYFSNDVSITLEGEDKTKLSKEWADMWTSGGEALMSDESFTNLTEDEQANVLYNLQLIANRQIGAEFGEGKDVNLTNAQETASKIKDFFYEDGKVNGTKLAQIALAKAKAYRQVDENGETVKNSNALGARQAYEEAGIYDEVVKYLEDNELDYDVLGLNKTVVKYSDEKADDKYEDIFGEAYANAMK